MVSDHPLGMRLGLRIDDTCIASVPFVLGDDRVEVCTEEDPCTVSGLILGCRNDLCRLISLDDHRRIGSDDEEGDLQSACCGGLESSSRLAVRESVIGREFGVHP